MKQVHGQELEVCSVKLSLNEALAGLFVQLVQVVDPVAFVVN